MAYGHSETCPHPGGPCQCPPGYWAERQDTVRRFNEWAPDHAWWAMLDAPKDGTVIRILVEGSGDDGKRFLGRWQHEFVYPVMWHQGRWCFARTKAPLQPWQQPMKWKPAS